VVYPEQNASKIPEHSSSEATPFPIEIMANPVNRFCAIVVRRMAFINFSLEELLSADTVEIAAIVVILNRIKTFRYTSLSFRVTANLNMSET
jgi:hypothetical protein